MALVLRAIRRPSSYSLSRSVGAFHSAASSAGQEPFKVPDSEKQVLLGCVCYCDYVGSIWSKMGKYLNQAGVPFSFVLFQSYEQQVSALLRGHIDIAWNGPIAHVMTQILAGETNVVPLGMRDVDRDCVSLCVARRDVSILSAKDLAGRTLATGATDSPQAHLVPLQWLKDEGITPGRIVAHDVDLGTHGDTAAGEVKAMEALLLRQEVDAAVVSKLMWDRALSGGLPSVDASALNAAVAVVPGNGPPLFDHCQFDALTSTQEWKRKAFKDAIMAMDMQNPEQQEVMKLEGISQSWMPPREEGYAVIRRALKQGGAFSGMVGFRGVSATATAGRGRPFSTVAERPGKRLAEQPVQRVGVIGGGIAGLQAARALRDVGLEPVIFERDTQPGGVWLENYMNFGVQVQTKMFEFPDFPSKLPANHYPTGPETLQYINDYIDNFQLRDLLRLRTRVVGVEQHDSGWRFKICDADGKDGVEQFDYCVVASGMFSKHNKFIPELLDRTIFSGEVIHSSDFQKPEQVAGKRVVVVGGGKSAIDCAVEAAKLSGNTVTLLSSQPHWPTPRKIAGLIPFQFVFGSRLGQALVIGHRGTLPGTGEPLNLWHKIGWPIMLGAFTLVKALFAVQFRKLSGPTSPLSKDLVDDTYSFAHVLDSSLQNAVESGRIAHRIGRIERYTKDGVQVEGLELQADVVIFGTGFAKDYSIFPEQVRKVLDVQQDGLYLYRHMIPPQVSRLAFVGSEIATLSNIATHGVQAAWLAAHLKGQASMPSPEVMAEDVEAGKAWKRSWMPEAPSRANMCLLHGIHYHDRLLKDIGIAHRRKGWNLLAEALMPYRGADYDGIVAEVAAK